MKVNPCFHCHETNEYSCTNTQVEWESLSPLAAATQWICIFSLVKGIETFIPPDQSSLRSMSYHTAKQQGTIASQSLSRSGEAVLYVGRGNGAYYYLPPIYSLDKNSTLSRTQLLILNNLQNGSPLSHGVTGKSHNRPGRKVESRWVSSLVTRCVWLANCLVLTK